ncbi:MAG: hypothetical protein ACOYB8_03395 [Eubacteriaceae bacterium]|jgi:hypothetical protein
MRPGVILFIVEGKSEEAVFGPIFEGLFPSNVRTVFAAEHSDFLTGDARDPDHVVNKLEELIYDSMRRNHYRLEDILEIVQLADTDGCYIPDGAVVQDDDAGKIRYHSKRIVTHDKAGIELRNFQKRKNLDRLVEREELLGIPYSIYYLSCNLDHVLTNVRNLPSKSKVQNAMSFARRYWRHPEEFVTFLLDPAVSAPGDYWESWSFIREYFNSLRRWSNLHLLFTEPKNVLLTENNENSETGSEDERLRGCLLRETIEEETAVLRSDV